MILVIILWNSGFVWNDKEEDVNKLRIEKKDLKLDL